MIDCGYEQPRLNSNGAQRTLKGDEAVLIVQNGGPHYIVTRWFVQPRALPGTFGLACGSSVKPETASIASDGIGWSSLI